MIKEFKGEYEFLSNFYSSWIELNGFAYPTVEHAFQAQKTLDEKQQKSIRLAVTPAIAKMRGRNATLRPDWEDIKISIMEDLIIRKFRIPRLKKLLLATRDQELQEGNWWHDTFWGIDTKTGEGHNHLGKILMKIRAEILRNQEKKNTENKAQVNHPLTGASK